ncbi:hypothetical protein PISMIDRAFT_678019 [Pisolithus microcarpus 441]|uniref:Nephrocystin 3-like N-terminal domain-containing protein n=1 Tax=Pisolithus microcarpus 441 TaxID=765257 RepID=A0A0C9ZQP0_9AGAM|nr:hypothetical protein PISMIDRAFT_678019 [Pisolithus microcarpus 441]
MTTKQSKKSRHSSGIRSSNSMSNLSTSRDQFQALSGVPTRSNTDDFDNPSRRALARMKRFFHRSSQSHPTFTSEPSTAGGEEVPGELPGVDPTHHTGGSVNEAVTVPVSAAIGGNIYEQVQEHNESNPMSRIDEGEVDPVDDAEIQEFSDTYLQPFQDFNAMATTLSKVHPHVRVAVGILHAASQVFMTQLNLDAMLYGLLRTVRNVYALLTEEDIAMSIRRVRETLGSIAQVVSDVAYFIKNYPEAVDFWKSRGKNATHKTQYAVDDYTRMLSGLMQQCQDGTVGDIQINAHRVLEDSGVGTLSCAQDAGFVLNKECLDNTRTEVLAEVISWVQDTSEHIPRIFWLYGQGGKGKSAIARTVAQWVKDAGGLVSYFYFARNRQAEHREGKIFTTIARDLADCDPAFRRALAGVIAKDPTLASTSDVKMQWEKLILGPLSVVKGATVGSVFVVIDALDESGLESSRSDILSALSSAHAVGLPRNFRVLVTSRPSPDIKDALRASQHIKVYALDHISAVLVERDVQLFVSERLGDIRDIGVTEVQRIARKADGVFEWARLACDFIKQSRLGQTAKERFDVVMSLPSGDGITPLDALYSMILGDIVPEDQTSLGRFRSVMQQVLFTAVPLPIDALNEMRSHFPCEEDRYDVAVVLAFMTSLVCGVVDRSSLVQLLHASFHDFLTDPAKGGIYFVGAPEMHDLAFASLEILCNGLQFNICGLESSYLSNAEVLDLQERVTKNISPPLSYSCKFWAQHLQKTPFDPVLVTLVKVVVGSEKLLFWLEALSLLGVFEFAADALTCTAGWLQGQNSSSDALTLAQEGIKFVENFGCVIAHSAPHLYLSALPFIPAHTMLSSVLMLKFACLPKVFKGYKQWPTSQLAMEEPTSSVLSVAISPDGGKVVSGSDDSTVRVWDAMGGVQFGEPLQGHTSPVNSVAFSHDGKRIVSGSDDSTVRIWDTEKGIQVGSTLEEHTSSINSVAFSPDGKRVVSGSSDTTIVIWDAKKGVQIGNQLEERTSIFSVAFSPNGKRIVSGSSDNTMRIWDVVKGSQIGGLLQGHKSSVFSVAYSPDGRRIASGSADKTVCIWDAERGMQIGRPLEGHDSLVFSVMFSPDGKKVVSGSADGTVRLWDSERGVQIGSPLDHTSAVNSVAFSLDGKRIVSGSDDGTIRVWDAESYQDVVNGYKKLNLYSPKVHTICFSSVSSHALNDSDQLHAGLLQNSMVVESSAVKLHCDGWIKGPMGRLLLWIHPTLRRSCYSMWTVLVIPIGCCLELDLSKMVHGSNWHKCFNPAALST